jgi:hypothetical protein
MPVVTETTPFPGAKTVYGRVYRLLRWMGEEGGHVVVHKKKGRAVGCTSSPEMDEIVEALNKGDEHKLKATLLDPRYFAHCH